MTLTSTRKNTIGAILIAVAALVFWVFDLVMYKQIPIFDSAISEHQAVLQKRKDAQQNIQSLYGTYQNRLSEIQKFLSIVPEGKEIAELISALETIAVQSGIEISEISIAEQKGAKTSKKGTRNVGISIKLLAPYSSILTFLNSIEQNIRVIDIQRIAVAPSIANTLLGIDIRGEAYFIK